MQINGRKYNLLRININQVENSNKKIFKWKIKNNIINKNYYNNNNYYNKMINKIVMKITLIFNRNKINNNMIHKNNSNNMKMLWILNNNNNLKLFKKLYKKILPNKFQK